MIRIRPGHDDIFVNIYQQSENQEPIGEPTKHRAELIVRDDKTVLKIQGLFTYDLRNNELSDTVGSFIILDWNFIKISEKLMLLRLSFVQENGADTFDAFELIGRIALLRKVHFLNLPHYELPLLDTKVYK